MSKGWKLVLRLGNTLAMAVVFAVAVWNVKSPWAVGAILLGVLLVQAGATIQGYDQGRRDGAER
jgi:ABC-type Fe3+-siderophore transport system permease subunit